MIFYESFIINCINIYKKHRKEIFPILSHSFTFSVELLKRVQVLVFRYLFSLLYDNPVMRAFQTFVLFSFKIFLIIILSKLSERCT